MNGTGRNVLHTPKGEFCEEKMAPWRKSYERSTLRAIASQQPLHTDILKSHYTMGNRKFAERVAEHEKATGKRLEDPVPGGYMMAKKKCTDSRQAPESLEVFFEIPSIHESTAGSIVREGHVFRVLHPDGFGVVEGHFECGAAKVAHQFHRDTFSGEPNEHILRILNSIPPAVAAPADPSVRDSRNAIHQATMARYSLKDAGKHQQVYPSFVTWEYGLDYQWLQGMPHPRIATLIENEARAMFEYGLAEGRSFAPQYATMSIMYDPYRLGRFNDPRLILDALMNEFFCPTFDFRRLKNGDRKPLSRSGLGSLIYANFHDNKGHVRGVGGESGTRLVGVMDPDERVLEHAISELVSNPQIREMTNNGQTILPIRYDVQSRLAVFL